jgi:hypothetical protein
LPSSSFAGTTQRFIGPYRSPFGTWGAGLTVVIAAVTLYFQLTDPVYREGVLWVALWFSIGILYFSLVGRHRLILSPEEGVSRGDHRKRRSGLSVAGVLTLKRPVVQVQCSAPPDPWPVGGSPQHVLTL